MGGKGLGNKKTSQMVIDYHKERRDAGIKLHQFASKINPEGFLNSDMYTVDLDNFINLMYTGPAFFGTPSQGDSNSLFYYDTSSTYTIVTANCSNCSEVYYNSENSTTATNVSDTNMTYDSLTFGNMTG